MVKRLQEQRLQEQPETSEVATVVDLPKNVILIDSETGLLDSDISSVQLQTQLQLHQLQTLSTTLSTAPSTAVTITSTTVASTTDVIHRYSFERC